MNKGMNAALVDDSDFRQRSTVSAKQTSEEEESPAGDPKDVVIVVPREVIFSLVWCSLRWLKGHAFKNEIKLSPVKFYLGLIW